MLLAENKGIHMVTEIDDFENNDAQIRLNVLLSMNNFIVYEQFLSLPGPIRATWLIFWGLCTRLLGE